MPQYEYIVPTAKQIQKSALKHKQAEDVLSARIDAQVTASTDSNADYAAEVADARVDELGNLHGSAGTCFRDGMERMQQQVQMLSETCLEMLSMIAELYDRNR